MKKNDLDDRLSSPDVREHPETQSDGPSLSPARPDTSSGTPRYLCPNLFPFTFPGFFSLERFFAHVFLLGRLVILGF